MACKQEAQSGFCVAFGFSGANFCDKEQTSSGKALLYQVLRVGGMICFRLGVRST